MPLNASSDENRDQEIHLDISDVESPGENFGSDQPPASQLESACDWGQFGAEVSVSAIAGFLAFDNVFLMLAVPVGYMLLRGVQYISLDLCDRRQYLINGAQRAISLVGNH